jgi:uncharacterized membrane protein
MKKLARHLRAAVIRGVLALLPIALTYYVLRFLYLAVDQKVAPFIERWLGVSIPGLGLVLVLVVLYLLGLFVGNWLGRKAFGLLETLTNHIPLVKTIYKMGRQLGQAFQVPEQKGLKRVVLIEQFRTGIWSIGFVMGTQKDEANGKNLLRLFVPTAPNPTTGFMIMVEESKVRDVDWSVPAAMNTVISGGIVGPGPLGSDMPREQGSSYST